MAEPRREFELTIEKLVYGGAGLGRVEGRVVLVPFTLPGERVVVEPVSEKGGLSIYGLGRFPVTLYRTQWERLLSPDTVKAIGAFIAANAKLLAVKE